MGHKCLHQPYYVAGYFPGSPRVWRPVEVGDTRRHETAEGAQGVAELSTGRQQIPWTP